MIAAAIMWSITTRAGSVSSLENFVNSSLSLRDWTIDGPFLFRQLGIITFLACIGFVLATVLATFIFNLASDLMGGIWVSVIEEESARPVGTADGPSDSDDDLEDEEENTFGSPESILEDQVG